MEEKKEDILKNLKRINSLGGALADLKSKVDTLKADISAINKRLMPRNVRSKSTGRTRRE